MAQQHLPDGGHPGGKGDAFGLHQLIQRFAIQRRARQHQLGPHLRGGVRNAPGIDVKHRHHRQYHVPGREAHRIGQSSGIGMQGAGAVAVQRPLGVARGAAGVAQAGGGVFIKLRPVVVAIVGSNPGFVADQAGGAAVCRQLVGIAQRHPLLDRGALAVYGLHQGQKAQVKAQHLVLGVIHDPGHLLKVQARVDGVQHPARAAHAVIHLQVAVTVPSNAGHPGTLGQAQGIQRLRQLLGALAHCGPGGAVNIALHPARDHFGRAVVVGRKFDHGRNQQRLVLHQTLHSASPWWCSIPDGNNRAS